MNIIIIVLRHNEVNDEIDDMFQAELVLEDIGEVIEMFEVVVLMVERYQ